MSRETSYLSWEEDGPVGLLTLRRPERANAYHQPLLMELDATLQGIRTREEIRVVVITGEGRHFCAGADLNELATRSVEEVLSLFSQKVFNDLARLPRLTLAAIRGAAMAGGLELALACDLRMASEDARFGLPETKLGLIPAAGGTQRLPRLIGIPRAKEMILAGRELGSEEALAWGLVTRLETGDTLLNAAMAWARQLAQRDPLALQLAKSALDQSGISEQDLRIETLSQALLVARQRSGR